MKNLCILFAIALISCNGNRKSETIVTTDSITTKPVETVPIIEPAVPEPKVYTNQRFKDVTVEKTGEHQFLIQGKAQIFEANLSWVVEDGHEELKKGFHTTDAGAPEWGNFKFTIDVVKKRPNSTLNLILFESSAKDGSRQHELPIVLY
jgi:hypothetical protein